MSTAIEWTDETWNPVTGCSKISAGCANCYAEVMDKRFDGFGHGHKPWTEMNAEHNVTLHPGRLQLPSTWKKPRRVFVNSMSDLFHEQVPFVFVRAVWARMQAAHQHTFQVLTKRPARMLEFFRWMEEQEVRVEASLPNVWIGVSVEDQRTADERIPLLLQAPAAVRFLSCEPLLGSVDLIKNIGGTLWMGGQRGCDGRHRHGGRVGQELHGVIHDFNPERLHHHHDDRCRRGIDWVIVGGESGHGARPMHPEWVRRILIQCTLADVPFFFKQWGEWVPADHYDGVAKYSTVRSRLEEGAPFMYRVGKKVAGRLLDGREWNEMPEVGRT